VTGDATRPSGEAQTSCRGENNPAGKRSKLHLDSGSDVRKAAGQDDTISLDLALGTRAIFSGQGRGNFSPEPIEQKGKNQPGPKGISDSQLTALLWAKNRAKARAPSPKWVLRLGRRPYWVPRTKAVTPPPRGAA
jgi:hypothetical protein